MNSLPFISVIIPNRNGANTIARCLEATFASRYPSFEVIVVDDASADGSVEAIQRFPCRLIRLARRHGAAGARNAGAAHARGDLLFFTDADCLPREDTLATACRALSRRKPATVAGGTYTPLPHDDTFFSRFQSVFIHHFETKRADAPDYVATHALAIRAGTFHRHGGFAEGFLPILEDVEFSHRLRRTGCRLVIDPTIQVRHVFNFNLFRSLHNACVKAMYWTLYSLRNRDLLVDSGTASHELKANVASYFISLPCVGAYLLTGAAGWLGVAAAAFAGNLLVSRGLLKGFRVAGGRRFAAVAGIYYFFVYPLAVGAGAFGGAALFLAGACRPRGTR
ncbi:MAG: glycosyltransferase [Betaproteobacteria bacterium]|nr:glycosyltransferase [Betaproteobacteria bacterium]